MHRFAWAAAAAMVGLSSAAAQAAPVELVRFDFDGGVEAEANALREAHGVTVGAWTDSTGAAIYRGHSFGGLTFGSEASDLGALVYVAQSTDRHASFTVTIPDGTRVHLDTFRFDVASLDSPRSGMDVLIAGGPTLYEDIPLWSLATTEETDLGIVLEAGTHTVRFQATNANGRQFGIDDVTLLGTIEPPPAPEVPEPAAGAMLVLAALSATARRPRR